MSKNLKVTSINMTEGNPYKIILMFSLPLLFGNILQQLYNLVDSVVVGNYVGEKALAAVGAGFPIIFMIVSLFAGIGMGATVMISQFFGAEDRKSISDTINTMYTAMMIGSIPLSLIGIFVTRPMLILMKVPDDGTLDMAVTYMIIAFIGLIGVIGYNTNAGILQGLGDSKTSLIFLAIATVINIILDVLFVVGFKWGLAGVAFATIIAQFCSWIFGIYYINKHFDYFKINIFNFKFKKQLFLRAMKLGIPAAIQQILFSVGTMFMQTLVNSYGSAFMAGFNGANKIDTFAFMPIQSFSVAMTTYAGQNIGAGKIDRV
ncbi:MAG: MATE family efflux transporter, partial [Oscillospiraceae bacterium]